MNTVWFITGASRGLGRALVEVNLAEGNRVIATARRRSACEIWSKNILAESMR